MVASRKIFVLLIAMMILAAGLFTTIGKTYAYNVITAAEGLSVTLEKLTDKSNGGTWTDIGENSNHDIPVFGTENWEPGAMRAAVLRVTNSAEISNPASPSLRQHLYLYATAGKTSVNLANAMTAYICKGTDIPLNANGRPDLSNSRWISLGRLSALSATTVPTALASEAVKLAPGESQAYTLLLKMDESAGNEYMGAEANVYAVVRAEQAS